jgi:hypothetical protein
MNALNVLRYGAFTLFAWLALCSAAAAQPPAPVASGVVDGSYTISYSPGCDGFLPPGFYCESVYLLEKIEPDGQWTAVSQDTGWVSFESRQPGTYSYVLWVTVLDYWYGYYEATSPVTTVVVAGPAAPAPVRDDILSQLNYSYEVRQGDFNRDNRTDLFIRKVAGGTPVNGTVENLILRQSDFVNGSFSFVLPSPDEAAVASAWAPAPSIETRLHDINVDGYVDLTLVNVASVVGGAADQIVYSPGQPGASYPRGIRHVDSWLASFVGDAMDYLYDPDHFIKNAPLYYYQYADWYVWCPLLGIGGLDAYYWQAFTYCYVDVIYYTGFYLDYSAFHPDAVALWTLEDMGESGQLSKEEALRAIRSTIESIIGSALGGWPMEELLGQIGEHTDGPIRQAIEDMQAILNGARAIPEHVDMDNLPPQTPRELDKIYVTGHRLPFDRGHLALEYAPPWTGAGLYAPSTLSGVAEHWPPILCWPLQPPSECGFGKLLAETNRLGDQWYMNFHVEPLVGTPLSYWENSLVPRHDRYVNLPYSSKLPYFPLPNQFNGAYNSNGYARGLNGFGGFFVVPLSMNSVYLGWDRPVPDEKFQ